MEYSPVNHRPRSFILHRGLQKGYEDKGSFSDKGFPHVRHKPLDGAFMDCTSLDGTLHSIPNSDYQLFYRKKRVQFILYCVIIISVENFTFSKKEDGYHG